MYEYFHHFCPFFHLSGCPAQSFCKAGEQEPEVMHFLRAGAEYMISNLLQGANTQKCSTLLLTSRAAELPTCLGKHSCFHNGKNLSEIQFLGARVTTSYKSLSRSVEGSVQTLCFLSSHTLTFSLAFAVFPCPFKGHSWDNAAESSPKGSWMKCFLKGAVTEGLQIFAQFSFFCLLHIPSIAEEIKASRWVAFPPEPTQPVWFPS